MVDYMDMTIPFLELPVPDMCDDAASNAYRDRYKKEFHDRVCDGELSEDDEEYKKATKRVMKLLEARFAEYWEHHETPTSELDKLPEEHQYDYYLNA